ncbi:MAG: tRNA pseudouridine(38-40) synthase TruA [Capnocytophaga sp.]|nr:tRNA pseudouridine(38-40) synthase TruA [Capnocytophaga sp.]
MRYFIEFSYNGKNYCGWQSQPHMLSVQEVLEQALSTLFRVPISLVGAGRTDAGVHSKQMFAHFDFDQIIDDNFIKKINSFLPKDIAVYHFHKVKDNAHARFDAIQRTYEYYINYEKDPFLYEFSYYQYQKLDILLMNNACQILKQYSDFQCFSKTKTDVKTYICEIKNAFWIERANQLIFTITADRFLRNMVRAIVGTMLNIGTKKINLTDFKAIIESKNRGQAGFSVPANALFLTEVKYPSEIFIN